MTIPPVSRKCLGLAFAAPFPSHNELQLTATAERSCELGFGHRVVSAAFFMTAENLVELFEEMVDLKIQHYTETHSKLSPEIAKLTPEVARLLQQKRETDRRRLDQIRAELVRFMES